jgi:hypothetical protein
MRLSHWTDLPVIVIALAACVAVAALIPAVVDAPRHGGLALAPPPATPTCARAP